VLTVIAGANFNADGVSPVPAAPVSGAGVPLVEVRDLNKSFPGVRALRGVNLTLNAGEVVAVIGENGAGKSTLMKILAGIQSADGGEVLVDGQPVRFRTVDEALALGIALIHQELNLADNLGVAANIFLGREPRTAGFVRGRQVERDARKFIDMVGLRVHPRMKVSHLSVGQQQMVEIAKALSTNARVLIMDEPTSSLSSRETEQLFKVVKDLRARGVCVLYISHRLGEVKELADRVVVLRDGQNAGSLARAEVSHDRMVRMMVGRELSQFYPHTPRAPGEVVLEVRGLRTPTFPRHEVSFTLRAGEVVSLAGLVGAGRTELLRTLFGVERPVGGTIHVGGQPLDPRSPADAIAAGLALVPEDRKLQGLVLEMGVRENISLPRLRRDALAGWLNRKAERIISREMIDALRVKTPTDRQVVQFLSGGNQQKVVLGKWLSMRPKVLLLDEPTRGVDVGAKAEIYGLMEKLAEQGVAILFASSEMEEVLGMSDRTLVMHEGRLSGELARAALSEEAIMTLATGNNPGAGMAGDESRVTNQ
jgi:ribose transport system ATP-binding protein